MTSPFSNSSSIVFYLEPVLNPYEKTYMQIITLNSIPNGPLADLVSQIHVPKLSTYQQFHSSIPAHNCVYDLSRYPTTTGQKANFNNPDSFMYADDIPSLFSYLTENGYTIQDNLTDLMFKSKLNLGGISQSRLSGNRKMICFALYSPS